jgi:hypothetical protein
VRASPITTGMSCLSSTAQKRQNGEHDGGRLEGARPHRCIAASSVAGPGHRLLGNPAGRARQAGLDATRHVNHGCPVDVLRIENAGRCMKARNCVPPERARPGGRSLADHHSNLADHPSDAREGRKDRSLDDTRNHHCDASPNERMNGVANVRVAVGAGRLRSQCDTGDQPAGRGEPRQYLHESGEPTKRDVGRKVGGRSVGGHSVMTADRRPPTADRARKRGARSHQKVNRQLVEW